MARSRPLFFTVSPVVGGSGIGLANWAVPILPAKTIPRRGTGCAAGGGGVSFTAPTAHSVSSFPPDS